MMFKNQLSLALRHLWKNKFHSGINLFGLSIGVSACLVIYLIVTFELSFNRDFEGYDRIYRIYSSFSGSWSGTNRGVPQAVGGTMRDQFTGLEAVARLYDYASKVEIPGGGERKQLDRQSTVAVTEPAYFDVFSNYQWIAGSPEVLSEPYHVVLTRQKAKTYFGTDDPQEVLGKEIIYRDSLSTTVAGILEDLPFHTDLDFTDFISLPTTQVSWQKKSFNFDDWGSVNSSTQVFFKLTPGTGIESVASQVPILSDAYKEHSSWGTENNFQLQVLSELHFNASVGIFDHSRPAAHLPTLEILIIIAVLLLVIGAINFINLETAQALRRAKEVGVRKVLGSSQRRLVAQFLTESILLTLMAILIAIPLGEFELKFFSEFVPEGVHLNILNLLPFLFTTVLVVGVLAGMYPAFIISSYQPVQVLKGQGMASGSGVSFLRKMLIVFQFTFAQVLIVGTLVISSQIHYLLDKDMGFRKDAIIYFEAPWWDFKGKVDALKNDLSGIANISDVSLSESPPAYNGWSSTTIKYKKGHEEVQINAYRKFADVDYLKLYEIPLLAGRNILPSDTAREFVVNETFVKELGFANPIDAIGQTFEFNDHELPIVGVMRDFHTKSLHATVDPVMLADDKENFNCLNVKLVTSGGDQMKATLDAIETSWKKYFPDVPFKYEFLDETIANFYQSEQRTSKLANTATGLAILISCLGLFGLASFATVQRTKEIGIRKVMGASVKNIVLLLSKEFILLVVIAFAVAAPVAWYLSGTWLDNFAYHMHPSLWLPALAGVIAVIIAFLTVGSKTFKAAHQNPAESLRSE